ncbi:SAM-dependent methyltransferase [Solimonas marina]|uniref:Class I SAM-dependent methyltransferase n=1 Tax=Solimonas marina TaxID=2714601 RepID=A0A970B9R3_9GAMM|nr:cyclopropane-fatty-acyl-phospholipid synthase family protein [Solimonas marina]NKF23619.1 class I SAM-dependent methyltransferase [Solimonas marina]
MSPMQMLLAALGHGFNGGTLKFTAGDEAWMLGHGEPVADIKMRDASVLRDILMRPSLRFGETYMEGDWEPGEGGLQRALEVGVKFEEDLEHRLKGHQVRALLGQMMEVNNPLASQKNVEHHYNLDAELYRYFLDEGMFYSCAYFERPDMTLEQAQQAKCALIARKLNLKPGMRVLDIGCGWGGLAIHLATHHGVHVTGITLSSEQLAVAQASIEKLGLTGSIEFRLEDYRKTVGEFDAIVSVGMFEHVGRPQYRTFFKRVRELLKQDGTALIHTIGRLTPPGAGNAWIRKYIFPGGYIPAASEMTRVVEASDLLMTDLEIWRLHYAETLAEWNRRFQRTREHFHDKLGERFCRMWEFYLVACESAFRWGGLCVFHLQLTKELERLPLTRNYLYEDAG